MSRLEEYIEDIMYLQMNKMEEGLETLKREGEAEYVTLKEAGFTLLNLIDSFKAYTDASQAVMEVRLKAIVGALPRDVQEKVLSEFNSVDDDLFEYEGENENE